MEKNKDREQDGDEEKTSAGQHDRFKKHRGREQDRATENKEGREHESNWRCGRSTEQAGKRVREQDTGTNKKRGTEEDRVVENK